MKEVIETCDFCGKRLDKNNWEVGVNRLEIHHTQSSCNPLEEIDRGNHQSCVIEVNDICWECSRKLSQGLLRFMKDMGFRGTYHD